MTESEKISKNKDKERSELNRQEDYLLVEKAKANDQKAFARIAQKYNRPLFFHVARLVRNQDVIDDLIQEIFLKAFDNIHSFDKNYAFSTWLFRIATNHSIDYLRKKKLQTLSIDEPYKTKDGEITIEIPDDTSEADENIIREERVKIILEAIESLPERYEQIIRLRHMEEKSYQEISEILNLPLGTVKAHIFRARELLNKYLKDKRGSF